MRAADPEFDINPELRALRRALGDRIEADLAALDMLGGDPDLEADNTQYRQLPGGIFASVGISADDEPSLCGVGTHDGGGGSLWQGYPRSGGNCGNDAEDLERDEADDEGSLGWSASVRQLALGPNTEDGDATALERHGAGFVRSGHEDAEDGHDAEGLTDDNGVADMDGIQEQGFRGYSGVL